MFPELTTSVGWARLPFHSVSVLGGDFNVAVALASAVGARTQTKEKTRKNNKDNKDKEDLRLELNLNTQSHPNLRTGQELPPKRASEAIPY